MRTSNRTRHHWDGSQCPAEDPRVAPRHLTATFYCVRNYSLNFKGIRILIKLVYIIHSGRRCSKPVSCSRRKGAKHIDWFLDGIQICAEPNQQNAHQNLDYVL